MKPKQTNLTVFAILTTLTLVTWALVEAYVRFYKVDITAVPPKVVQSLNPSLNTRVLDDLENRTQLSEIELLQYAPKKAASPAPTAEPVFIQSTTSASIASESATESAATQ